MQSAERVWVVYACVLLQACLSHLLYPARSTLVPQLVAAADLPAANALDALTAGVARLLGPLLGGVPAGLFGFVAAVEAALRG